MTTPLIHHRIPLIAAILLTANTAAWATNPEGGTCSEGGGPCDGDNSIASASSASNVPSIASLDWDLKVGLARYPKPATFTDLGQAAFEKNGNLPTFKEVYGRYFSAKPLQQTQIHLELSQPAISAASFHPSCLFLQSEASFETLKKTDANFGEYIHQILTDDCFTLIQNLTGTPGEGFRIRVWKRCVATLTSSNGYYLTNGFESKPTLTDVTFKRPDDSTDDNTLIYIQSDTGSARTITNVIVQTLAGGKPATITSTVYQGTVITDPAKRLKQEVLTYSASTHGSRPWDYNIAREVFTAGVEPSQTPGAPPVIKDLSRTSKTYEEYQDFSISANGGEQGMKRLVSKTEAYDIAGQIPQLTSYTYESNTGNTTVHGRLQSITRPDGSWAAYEYSISPISPVSIITEYSSWLNEASGSIGTPNANARKRITTVDSQDAIVQTYIAGHLVSKTKTSRTIVGTETRITTREWDGTGTVSNGDVELTSTNSLSTITAYFSDSPAVDPAPRTGRIKRIEHPDGTVSTFDYTATTVVETTPLTVTTTTYGPRLLPIGQETKTLAGIIIAHWCTEGEVTDDLGHPLKRIYNGNEHDYDQSEYTCCGLARFRDRDGSVTTYTRDYLKRVCEVTTQAAADSAVIRTTTEINGLTTTVKRKCGTTTLPVSETTRSLDGLTITRKSPDADGDPQLTPETTSIAIENNSGGGTTTTTTHPDTTTTVTVTCRDGQQASFTDQEDHVTTYEHGPNTGDVGGLWSKTIAANSTQWTNSYTDPLGRTFKTEYADESFATSTYYDGTAAAGSRGKLASSTDPDENSEEGTGNSVSYFYNAAGERETTREALADNFTRTTLTETDVIATVTIKGVPIEPAIRTTTTVNDILVSIGYKSIDGKISAIDSFGRQSITVRTMTLGPDPENEEGPEIPVAGSWTVTSVGADDVQTRQFFTGGLLMATVSFASGATLPNTAPEDITAVAPTTGFISGTSHTYYSFGRTHTTTDSRTGTTTINGHLENGAITSVTTNGGNDTTSYAYDVMGRRLTSTLPDNSVTHTTYTPRGQVEATWGSQTYPVFRTYDVLGRLSELHTWRNYSSLDLSDGASTAELDASSTTTFAYDPARGWLNNKRDAENMGADYTYTPAGRIHTRTWARIGTGGNRINTTYGYDQGMLKSVTYANDPVGTPNVSYTYDSFGRVRNVTQGTGANANTHIRAYMDDINDDNDPETENDPPFGVGLGLRSETVSYDSGALTRTILRHEDGLQRPSGWVFTSSGSTQNAVSYGYDTAGRLQYVHPAASLPANPADSDFTYNYLAKSYKLVETVEGPAHTVTNTWEDHRDVLGSKLNRETVGTSSVSSSFTYTVNNIGQRTTLSTDGTAFGTKPAWIWGYNSRGELVSANDTTLNNNDFGYIYDHIGNRLATGSVYSIDQNGVEQVTNSVTYASNPVNEYTTAKNVSLPDGDPPETELPAYDADGNYQHGPLPVDYIQDHDATLVWNGENRLVKVTKANNDVIDLAYDFLGRRISKTVTPSAGTAATTRYFYDGWNLIAEYNATGLKMTYTWGMDLSGSIQDAGGVGGLLSATDQVTAGHPVFYPTFDGNGNVSEYLDGGGNVVAHYEYDPFGNDISPAPPQGVTFINFAHRFSTKYLDAETGLYYYGYRYYDPVTGRWPSRDPLQEVGGSNLYAFGFNRPVVVIDGLGLNAMLDYLNPNGPVGDPNSNLDSEPTNPLFADFTDGIDPEIDADVIGTCEYRCSLIGEKDADPCEYGDCNLVGGTAMQHCPNPPNNTSTLNIGTPETGSAEDNSNCCQTYATFTADVEGDFGFDGESRVGILVP